MKIVSLHQADAFTDTLFGGNPAAVVVDADTLTDSEMQSIAKEMNLSEIAFVAESTESGADFTLRWFTPEMEVDFCGHATIGTLFELARLRKFGLGNEGEQKVRVATKSGLLDMWASVHGPRITAAFASPPVKLKEYHLQGSRLADALNIPNEALQPDAKVLLNAVLNDLFIPVTSAKKLGQLRFNFAHIRKTFKEEGIVAFGLFAADGKGLQARGLAPLVGVDEDPFTGRLQAGLVKAAKQNGLLPSNQNRTVVRQGHFVGRPGQATIVQEETMSATKVVGNGVHVFSTKITI